MTWGSPPSERATFARFALGTTGVGEGGTGGTGGGRDRFDLSLTREG